MTKRLLISAIAAAGIVLAPAAFAQDKMSKDNMSKPMSSSDKTDKMDKTDTKDGMKKDAMGDNKMKKDGMSK